MVPMHSRRSLGPFCQRANLACLGSGPDPDNFVLVVLAALMRGATRVQKQPALRLARAHFPNQRVRVCLSLVGSLLEGVRACVRVCLCDLEVFFTKSEDKMCFFVSFPKPQFVLTGRPTNFDEASRAFHPRTCRRSADEVDVPAHAALALAAGAAHLRRFAARHGVTTLRLYDGGVAPTAPLAHAAHVREWLFGRADLVTQTVANATSSASARASRASFDGGSSRGRAVRPSEYAGLVAELDASLERGALAQRWIGSDPDCAPLLPLSELATHLAGASRDGRNQRPNDFWDST